MEGKKQQKERKEWSHGWIGERKTTERRDQHIFQNHDNDNRIREHQCHYHQHQQLMINMMFMMMIPPITIMTRTQYNLKDNLHRVTLLTLPQPPIIFASWS